MSLGLCCGYGVEDGEFLGVIDLINNYEQEVEEMEYDTRFSVDRMEEVRDGGSVLSERGCLDSSATSLGGHFASLGTWCF